MPSSWPRCKMPRSISRSKVHELQEFLRRGAETSFGFGICDCALWACDWIVAQRGVDPGAAFRGRYLTGLGCARLLLRHGGLPALADDVFHRAGLLRRWGEPQAGDIGCIRTTAGEALAIHTGTRWAWKGERCLTVSAGFPVIAAWQVWP